MGAMLSRMHIERMTDRPRHRFCGEPVTVNHERCCSHIVQAYLGRGTSLSQRAAATLEVQDLALKWVWYTHQPQRYSQRRQRPLSE